MKQATGGMVALGGGVYLVGADNAGASVAAHAALRRWGAPWRPESPRRLSDVTHALAQRAIGGEHGRIMAHADFRLNDDEMIGLSPDMRYAAACMLVAEKAPLRVLPGERIIGSATLLEAPEHNTPVANVASVSHTTLGFDRVLKEGYQGIRNMIEARLARGGLDNGGEDLLRAMLRCLDAAGVWHARHMMLLEERIAASDGEERANYIKVRDALRHVPEQPASNFHEAVQSLWFAYAFQRLMGTWSGIGRIDEMLGPYLRRDLQESRLTLDEAREILAHFWIKGCEWVGAFDTRGSGDAQHYQNIILSGIDAQGCDVTNEVTWLVLDIVEELHISDFPIAVRVSKRTPESLFRRIAEVQRHGGGIVAIYNEDVVIDGLVQFGYPLEEARCFANDGCWEVLIPGKTAFSYVPFDALALLHQTLGLTDEEEAPPQYPDFESLYAAFVGKLRKQVDAHHAIADNWALRGDPTPLVSLLVHDCIERGRSYCDRGAHYTVLAPHAGRLANVANSLLVLKRLVYEDGFLSLPDFVSMLRNDWQGQENLRQMILNRFDFYGNDAEEADAMVQRVFDDYTAIVAETRERHGVLRPAGISTFGREIVWSQQDALRKATADGHHEGAVLATNFSPSPGTDKKGPTAVIRSYCKMDYRKTPNGATLELKIHPESVKGDAGRDAIVALMRTFVELGGWFLHVDVVDSAMLIDAQRHPEKYPNLAVRVAGWSARFATLNKDWQDMIIARTQQVL